MVDNLVYIKQLLKFEEGTGDTYYYLQVIKRRKDNPGMTKSEIKLGSGFITSLEKLDTLFEVYKERADLENGRIYISLAPRSLKRFTGLCLMEYGKRVANESYQSSWRIPDQVALMKETIKTKGVGDVNFKGRWIVDIDYPDPDYKNKVYQFLYGYTKIQTVLLTPRGYHIVVDPFNYRKLDIEGYRVSKSRDDYQFNGSYQFTLRREGNTILYAP